MAQPVAALQAVNVNIVMRDVDGSALKRKRDTEPAAEEAAARPRVDQNDEAVVKEPQQEQAEGTSAPPRLQSLDEASDFLSASPSAIIVFTGDWKGALNNKAIQCASRCVSSTQPLVPMAHAEFSDDAWGGELFYEHCINRVPTVRVYRNGGAVGDVSLSIKSSDGPKDWNAEAEGDIKRLLSMECPAAGAKADDTVEIEGMPPKLRSKEEFKAAIASPGLTVVDFFATWCKPCMRIMPELPQMARDYDDVKFYKCDRDELKELHDECDVVKIPTFQVYKDGERLDSLQHSDHLRIRAMIDKYRGVLSFDDDF